MSALAQKGRGIVDSRVREFQRFGDQYRFRIELLRDERGQVLRVTDRRAGERALRPLIEWRGARLAQLHQCGVLPDRLVRSGVQYCDKSFVQHLTLAAASAELARERFRAASSGLDGPGSEAAADIAGCHGVSANTQRAPLLSGLACRVSNILEAHPAHHFEFSEVLYMLISQQVCVAEQSVRHALSELEEAKRIQTIRIDQDTVFFDTNTAPHPHVYDERNRALRDVAATEVVSTDGGLA